MRSAARLRLRSSTSGITDSFNRADNAASMGSADTGQVWVPNSGTWGILGNQAYTPSAPVQATTVINAGVSDCTVQVTISVAANGAGLCWRSTDDNNHFLIETGGVTIPCFRKQGGGYTLVGSLAAEPAFASGDVLTVVLAGTLCTVKKNGTTLYAFTDAIQSTATRHGLRCNATSVARFDNFSIV